jgi:hypothetical protein
MASWCEIRRLPYTQRTNKKFRDLRDLTLTSRRHFARISLNGQYRVTKSNARSTKHSNPGWILGTENIYLEWTHFRRHCWHVSINVYRRGITLSFGKKR